MLEFKIIILGILQGITEFLPISSSGHLVIFGHIFNITNDNIVTEVVLHFGTLISILIYFRKDIGKLLIGIANKEPEESLYGFNIFIATLPIVFISLFIKDSLGDIFSIDTLLYTYLINAVILFSTKYFRVNGTVISTQVAFVIGCAQMFALLPGVSRAGVTICTGLILGCARQDIAKFSFFMAIPALIGAIFFELENILRVIQFDVMALVLGFTVSMITGLIFLKLLFKILESNRLWIFSFYCIFIWAIITFII